MRSYRLPQLCLERSQLVTSRSWLSTTLGCGLLVLCTHCAVYDSEVDASLAAASEATGGTTGSAGASNGPSTGGSLAADSDRFYGGGSAPAGSGSGDNAAIGGSTVAPDGSVVPISAGAPTAGGVSSAGGTGTSAGAGGGADQPSGTGSVADDNLSVAKPVRTDSEQSHKFHFARDANDGDRSTRWCATDWKANHYWEVDLGSSFSLSALRILWEKDSAYLFKVESSVDGVVWTVELDKTESNFASADQHYALRPGANGRYVRITVTGGLTTTSWASFYEAEVFGR